MTIWQTANTGKESRMVIKEIEVRDIMTKTNPIYIIDYSMVLSFQIKLAFCQNGEFEII